jgi:hypothetical protein
MMPQKSFKKIHSGLVYGSIILLLAYCISFYAFLYTGNCIPNYHSVPGSEVKTYNEIVINKVDFNNTFLESPNLILKASTSVQKLQADSILSQLTDLLGSGSFELLIFVIILFLRVQSVFLPDEFSLINRKVRLND